MRDRTSFLFTSVLILCSLPLTAQTPTASSPGTNPPSGLPSSVRDTLRVYSREVVLDINVTDAKGNPVHGLTRDNFTVLENGRPVTPRSFREHRPDDQIVAATAPALPPNTFTNAIPVETARPLNILLLDSLDTPIATQSIVQSRMVEFVEKMPPGTRVAIFNLSPTGELAMLQGFTSDVDLLKKAIKSKKLGMQIPTLEDTGQDPANDVPQDVIQTQDPRSPKPITIKQEVKIDLNVECNHAAARGQYTATAMEEIGRYLSGMPGRKNVIWFSGAFPTRMRDKQGGVCYDLRDDLQYADDLLANAHAVVYPVDPRSLDLLAKGDPTAYPVRQQSIEHLTMEAIAQQTGGKAIYNTNDLAAAAEQAVDAGANYYTITYVPSNQTNDTRLRTISVKTDQPDLTLLYKTGYYAIPPGTTVSGKASPRATPVQSAMMRGTLPPSQILFHVTVVSAPATDAAMPPGNKPDPKAMKPPYRRLSVSYLVDISGIQFDQASDGNYHGQFEYAVNVYNTGDGKIVNSNDMAAHPALPATVYQSMLNSGAKLGQQIDIPAKGDYILRVGVHDLTTDHVGAIEIPVSSIH
jgi:VWFA-related protein